MYRDEFLKMSGNFSWNFGSKFFVETSIGNFIWNDPDYGGDNIIKEFPGTYGDFLEQTGTPYCRDKGIHIIGEYVPKDITVIFTDLTTESI